MVHQVDSRPARATPPLALGPVLILLSGIGAGLLGAGAASAHIDLLQESGIVRLDSATAAVAARTWGRHVESLAIPDIFGPGNVLRVGNVHMKVTNYAVLGNPFTNVSSDPSGQWKGSSGVEYLNAIAFAVGGVNHQATDPNAIRRVSYFSEWRPPSLDPIDKIYPAYDGVVNGLRFVNDDGDHDADGNDIVDEDFLDGRDNDLDGKIDEDHGALGQQEFSFVMRDNTIEAINTVFNEKHVPLGLEARCRAWAYSIQGFQDFDVCEYDITNISGHTLDSLVVGWLVDMDAGPVATSSYWLDDLDLPNYPSGQFVYKVGSSTGDLPDPLRAQKVHDPSLDTSVGKDSALCPRVTIRVNGFSTADDNGDDGKTPGIGSFMLIDHSVDPLGISGPKQVGFRAFRSYTAGTPYQQGGQPRVDQERFEFMTSHDNVDEATGFINRPEAGAPKTKGDYVQWCSIGPWFNVPDGGTITATIAFGVSEGLYVKASQYTADYDLYAAGSPEMTGADLDRKYASLHNALTAQIAFEGVNEPRDGFPKTDFHGRETKIKLPKGSPQQIVTELCPGRDRRDVVVTDRDYSWFDFDCDYCTGVWDYTTRTGLFHKTWNASAPPPNPNTNVAATYDFSDNPYRTEVPSGDHAIRLAWDNGSEIVPDPKSRWLDFRGYDIWKVTDWTRPVGSPGPSESDWKLLGEFRHFDFYTKNDATGIPIERNYERRPDGTKNCPLVYIPDPIDTTCYDPVTGRRSGCLRPICLNRGDLWNIQTGQIIKPDWSVPCSVDTLGRQIKLELTSPDIEFNGGSYEHVFHDEGQYDYLCFRHPNQKARVLVTKDGPDSAVVQIVDAVEAPPGSRGTGFKPNLVTVRAGGYVRWVNASPLNHTVSSDRQCLEVDGCIVHRANCDTTLNLETRVDFPVGRYHLLDTEVKNGFLYFYSVTAFDSTTFNSVTTELGGRRSAVEAEGVVPQVAARDGAGRVWVVPNPYRGFARIGDRPSSWDLTPNASDPTGTHIDFMGLPRGKWKIRIYTISGDLVQELHSDDPVNDSVRQPVAVPNPNYNPGQPEDPVKNPRTIKLPGFNRQQDNANDGQARWNLISRNGQDVVSGIYLFTVESDRGTQRGKFVIIR